MKKIAIATFLAFVSIAASALDIGVLGGETFNSNKHSDNSFGLTVGQNFGKLGVTAEADHNFSKRTLTNANRYSLITSYEVTKVGKAQLSAKAGVDYLTASHGLTGGYGLMAGVGASLPVTQKISATFDYRYDAGQSRVKAQNGNQFLVGVKYSF